MPRHILTRLLDAWVDPARTFVGRYASESTAFWLDGGIHAASGMSYLGSAERTVVAGSFDELVAIIRRDLGDLGPISDEPGSTGFRLGWVGWLGYELGAGREGVPTAEAATPPAAMMFVDRAIAFDHDARAVTLLALGGDSDSGDAAALAWLDDTAAALRELAGFEGEPSPAPYPLAPSGQADAVPGGRRHPVPVGRAARWRHSAAEYERLVERCQESIRRGDAYQLCLTNEVTASVWPDPLSTYLALRASSPSHHGGYLRVNDVALLSASPEQFLHIDTAGVASTMPIKGTRPRGETPDADAALAAELLASEKERAENLMIVDLMRNDLARVAALGTVEVTGLLAVESYSAVHQLVSTVRARLREDVDALDAVAALFPAGSMTGAPKISAMRILHGLEAGPRGIYAGAFGYLGVDGAVDLAMVIRSIVLSPRGASIGTGGGITALSIPADEVEETAVKAAPLLAVLGLEGP